MNNNISWLPRFLHCFHMLSYIYLVFFFLPVHLGSPLSLTTAVVARGFDWPGFQELRRQETAKNKWILKKRN